MYLFYVCLLAPLIQNGFSLIGEETDLNSLSNYDAVDDLNENYEIWNTNENDDAGIVIFDSISRQLLENICENSNTLVYITQEDITIDCKTFNKGDQPIDEVQSIVKRSADEELEGSGDDKPDGDENVKSETNDEVITTTQEAVEAEAEEKESEPQPQEQIAQAAPASEKTEITTTEAELETTTEAELETTTETQVTTQPPEESITQTETTQPEEVVTKAEDNLQTEPETEAPITTEQSDKENESKTAENAEQIPNKETDDNSINKEKNEEGKKKGKSLLPSSENDERGNDDEPVKTDKSTESTKKAGSKDTTILIVLFVAVVVVGALAFAYNFIKKRKRQNADLERVERAPSIKRSLQNLTQGGGEQEKKPLIGDNKEVEMVDMKKETSTLKENGESLPNEMTAKT